MHKLGNIVKVVYNPWGRGSKRVSVPNSAHIGLIVFVSVRNGKKDRLMSTQMNGRCTDRWKG